MLIIGWTLSRPSSQSIFGPFGCVFSFLLAYPLPNVALKGKASQSSTLSFSDASKAIDGRRNSFYGSGYCSHTAGDETDPWWRVDLQKKFIITTVKVTNRGDCCHERLDGAEIRIGNEPRNNGNNNSSKNPSCCCVQASPQQQTQTHTFHCNDRVGRYIQFIFPHVVTNQWVKLCEVEVYSLLVLVFAILFACGCFTNSSPHPETNSDDMFVFMLLI
uniref:Si:cabz01040626.2 n=1 Tax=Takifugu rubripes TaxID=31033 RepID=A0A674NHT3_TAKRU